MSWTNLEKRREYDRKWRAEHPDKCREWHKKYRENHPEKSANMESGTERNITNRF